MKEIKYKNNATNLKVYIDDFPDLTLMPKIDYDILIEEIEILFNDYLKIKRKKPNKTNPKNNST